MHSLTKKNIRLNFVSISQMYYFDCVCIRQKQRVEKESKAGRRPRSASQERRPGGRVDTPGKSPYYSPSGLSVIESVPGSFHGTIPFPWGLSVIESVPGSFHGTIPFPWDFPDVSLVHSD